MSAPLPPEHESQAGAVFTWAAGGALLCACVDLLVSVLFGLSEVPAERSLLPAAGIGAFVSMGLAAAAWSWPVGGLRVVGVLHLVLAGAGWFLGGEALGDRIPVPWLVALGAHLVFASAAFAGSFSGDGERPEAVRDASLISFENFESVLVAIVFALLIRHFAVEAYKIPTESMSPTLLGDRKGRGPGDRVLVAKWRAATVGPDRWEIWVFRPPLDRTINYVKRVIGLPGEFIEIENGDIYVDGAVARKSPKTREQLWLPVWPDAFGAVEAESPWTGAGFRRVGDRGFVTEPGAERRLLEYLPEVRNDVMGRSGADTVGDLRVSFDVTDAVPDTVLLVRLVARAGPVEVEMAADGSSGVIRHGGTEHPIPAGAAPGRVAVSFADLRIAVAVDGEPIAVVDTEVERGRVDRGRDFGVQFGVARGGATFEQVTLERDVFYTGRHVGDAGFHVPEGHYLFLGDNSASSQDSRLWRAWVVEETGGAGRVFLSENRPRTNGGTGRVEFTDRDGIFRSLPADAVEFGHRRPVPFVPLEDLHGRAFSIFWPPSMFSEVGGRVGILP